MIALTLQKWFKVSFPFLIVEKWRGILNDSCYVTKWLEASLPFSIGAKCRDSLSGQIIWFRTQGKIVFEFIYFQNPTMQIKFKKCAWNSKLNKFEKKVRLEFGTKQFYASHLVKEIAPGVRTSHHWFSNTRWRIFLTRIPSLRSKLQAQFFCPYAPRYFPRLKSFDFVSWMGTSPFTRSFLIPWLMPWFSKS